MKRLSHVSPNFIKFSSLDLLRDRRQIQPHQHAIDFSGSRSRDCGIETEAVQSCLFSSEVSPCEFKGTHSQGSLYGIYLTKSPVSLLNFIFFWPPPPSTPLNNHFHTHTAFGGWEVSLFVGCWRSTPNVHCHDINTHTPRCVLSQPRTQSAA